MNKITRLVIAAIFIFILVIIIIAFNKMETRVEIVEKVVEVEVIKEVEKIIEVEKKVYIGIELEDWIWLSRIIYSETTGDIDANAIAVGNVVMNRVKSPDFPNTVKEVIWQNTGIYQFSPCADGRIYLEPDERAIENARLVLQGLRTLPDDVLYFYMPTEGNKGNWIRSREVYKKIGVHVFSR